MKKFMILLTAGMMFLSACGTAEKDASKETEKETLSDLVEEEPEKESTKIASEEDSNEEVESESTENEESKPSSNEVSEEEDVQEGVKEVPQTTEVAASTEEKKENSTKKEEVKQTNTASKQSEKPQQTTKKPEKASSSTPSSTKKEESKKEVKAEDKKPEESKVEESEKLPVIAEATGEATVIQWEDFFDTEAQNEPSAKFKKLDGKKVELIGYMGDGLSISDGWFLMIKTQNGDCPFCSADESYWNEVMVIYVKNKNYLRNIQGKVKVTGTLDVGVRKDETGYKTMFRLYHTDFSSYKD